MAAWRGARGVLAMPLLSAGQDQNPSGCISPAHPVRFPPSGWSRATGRAAPGPVTHRLVSHAPAKGLWVAGLRLGNS